MQSTRVKVGRVLTVGKAMSRSEFLKLGGAVLVGLALLGVAKPAF